MTSTALTLETRYYDDGAVLVRLYKSDAEFEKDDPNMDPLDVHYDFIGKDEDYESLGAWIADLDIDEYDAIPLARDLNRGLWVDIAQYT